MGAIAFIPVRGGSKSIPKKNVKLLNNKPLLYWTAKAAHDCELIDTIVVATDDKEIENVAISFGFNKLKIYRRSSQNATDSASTESVMLEYLEQANHDSAQPFILIQATNPFIKSIYLTEAIELYHRNMLSSIISCSRFKRFLWNPLGSPINYDFNQRPRRQEFDGCFLENGAFYINSIKRIITHKNRLSEPIQIYEMPEYTSYEIDEPEDWIIVEELHKRTMLKSNS